MEREVAEIYGLVVGNTILGSGLCSLRQTAVLSGLEVLPEEGKEAKWQCPLIAAPEFSTTDRSLAGLPVGLLGSGKGRWGWDQLSSTAPILALSTLPFSGLSFYWGKGAKAGFIKCTLTCHLSPSPEPQPQ